MSEEADAASSVFDEVLTRITACVGERILVAIAGPPGAGKSTLAEALAASLNRARPESAAVIPMDGFHYDDAILEQRGLRSRKGSPATFDVNGFRHLLGRLKARAGRDGSQIAFCRFGAWMRTG
jgi:pantothenate kinase